LTCPRSGFKVGIEEASGHAGQIQTASEEASGGPSSPSPNGCAHPSRAGPETRPPRRRASPCRLGHRGGCGGASDRHSAEDAAAPQRPDTR
jgi:hypothetical protein